MSSAGAEAAARRASATARGQWCVEAGTAAPVLCDAPPQQPQASAEGSSDSIGSATGLLTTTTYAVSHIESCHESSAPSLLTKIACAHCDCGSGIPDGRKVLLRGPVPVTSDTIKKFSPMMLNAMTERSKRRVVKPSPTSTVNDTGHAANTNIVVSSVTSSGSAEYVHAKAASPLRRSSRQLKAPSKHVHRPSDELASVAEQAAIPGCVNQNVLDSDPATPRSAVRQSSNGGHASPSLGSLRQFRESTASPAGVLADPAFTPKIVAVIGVSSFCQQPAPAVLFSDSDCFQFVGLCRRAWRHQSTPTAYPTSSLAHRSTIFRV